MMERALIGAFLEMNSQGVAALEQLADKKPE